MELSSLIMNEFQRQRIHSLWLPVGQYQDGEETVYANVMFDQSPTAGSLHQCLGSLGYIHNETGM